MIDQLSVSEFIQKLEAKISTVVMEIQLDNLYNWNEDYITLSILKELRRNFRQVTIKYSKNKFIHVKTNFLKFNRKLKAEEKYGDIAILINLSYDDGISLEGVGLLEAKRFYQDKKSFSAINQDQLRRINENAPHAFLMLYDYERIDKNQTFKNYLLIKKKFFQSPLYASLIPINIARNFPKIERDIYRFSTAFSYQFAYRYMHGLDLEFTNEIIQAAKGYQVAEINPPQYVIQVSIKHTKDDKEIDLVLPEVNLENFTKINNDSTN